MRPFSGTNTGLRSPYVSIARRRFVVLRQAAAPAGPWRYCFNRPQAIRCLATCFDQMETGATPPQVSIARRRFVVLRPLRPEARPGHPDVVSIARRRFVVLRPRAPDGSGKAGHGFNRPQAIRCLATRSSSQVVWAIWAVSIARRRFVVLRLLKSAVAMAITLEFQSPAGDSLSCDQGAEGHAVALEKFQSPAGDSLSCDLSPDEGHPNWAS